MKQCALHWLCKELPFPTLCWDIVNPKLSVSHVISHKIVSNFDFSRPLSTGLFPIVC